MTLVYRAVWTDQTVDPIELLDRQLAAWAAATGLPPESVADRGTWSDGVHEVEVRRGWSETGAILRATLIEHQPGGCATTTVTATSAPGHDDGDRATYWVDLDVENEAVHDEAPGIVRLLLDASTSAVVGRIRVGTTPTIPHPGRVTALIRDILDRGRHVPVLVLTSDEELPPDRNVARATATATVLAGVVGVWLLSPPSLEGFNDGLPLDLRLADGGARIYLPDLDLDDPLDADRHRWVPATLMDEPLSGAGTLLRRRLLGSSLDADPPAAWERLRHLVARPGEVGSPGPGDSAGDTRLALAIHMKELAELLVLSETERDRDQDAHAREAAVLRTRLAQLKRDHLDDMIQLEGLTRELGEARTALRTLVARQQRGGALPATVPDDSPQRAAHVAERARRELSNLSIPDGALRDLHRLDDSEKRTVWAGGAWQALRALDEYAKAVAGGFGGGGFFQWCKRTGEWSTAKVSMTESETVMSNERLSACRLLPVDPAVEPTGYLVMEAHLKIQLGGGPNIPRVYFHDDTKGPTAKVHIGFYGPHDLMPNTRTS